MNKEELIEKLLNREIEASKDFDRDNETKTCIIDGKKITVKLMPIYGYQGNWCVSITSADTLICESGGIMSYDAAKLLYDEFGVENKDE